MWELVHVAAVQNRLGEGPLWNPKDRSLYWVDIEAQAIYRLRSGDSRPERFAMGTQIGALGIRKRGGFVLAARDGFAFWEPQTDELQWIVNPEVDVEEEHRFNDGAVDPGGRFWAGTMHPVPTASLYRLDPDLSVKQMRGGVTVSNGIGWSPDRNRMYYTDTPTQKIDVYDYNVEDGEIVNRRTFVETEDEPGFPDGLAVDSRGCVWSARWAGWKVVCYDPEGKKEREIQLPVSCPTSCAFGGPNYNILYITSAWTGFDEDQRKAQPLAGDLFCVFTDRNGIAANEFLG